jgi:peptidyl-prolyl cis-trans isomerase C
MTSSPSATTTGEDAERTAPADRPRDEVVEKPTGGALAVRLAGMGGHLRRRPWIAGLVLLLVAGGAFAAWRLTAADLPDGVAFEIGETQVTADEVDQRIDALQALYGVEVPDSEDGKDTFQRDAAKSMAVQVMLEDEAEERDIAVAEKDVSDTLQVLIDQRYPQGGRDAFIAALGDMGATEDQVRDEIRSQLLVSRLFDAVVADVGVDDEELRAAFDERRDELGTPARRVIRNIVVDDRATAARILGLVRSGTSFETAASSYSLDGATRDRGGLVGTVAATDLEGTYADAAFRAGVGDLFGPVHTRHGWNVGRVDRVVEPVPATFARVRAALRETLVAEKSLEAWRDWLGDVIADHDVTYADAYRPDDPDAVPDIDEAQLSESGRDGE